MIVTDLSDIYQPGNYISARKKSNLSKLLIYQSNFRFAKDITAQSTRNSPDSRKYLFCAKYAPDSLS